MMRKTLIVLGMALVLGCSWAAAPAVAATTTEQALILKKKKAAEARKKAEQQRLAAEARKRAAAKKQVSARRECGSFLHCLFGKPRAGVQRASLSVPRGSGTDRVTADNISWAPGTKYKAGSIVVNTPERSLYLVLGDGKARRYKVGVGREGFQWSGNSRIVRKAEWPSWTPPKTMIEREAAKGHYIPDFMEGGPGNPLGARALYIGGTIFRIHGTNNAASIGGAVSSGCIRMMNSDVIDLYKRVNVGARVYVYQ